MYQKQKMNNTTCIKRIISSETERLTSWVDIHSRHAQWLQNPSIVTLLHRWEVGVETFVVVVCCNRENFLGVVLTHHIVVEELVDLWGVERERERERGRGRERINNNKIYTPFFPAKKAPHFLITYSYM